MLHLSQQVKQPEDSLLSVRGRAHPNKSKETHTHEQTKTVTKSQSSQTFLLEGVVRGTQTQNTDQSTVSAMPFQGGVCPRHDEVSLVQKGAF